MKSSMVLVAVSIIGFAGVVSAQCCPPPVCCPAAPAPAQCKPVALSTGYYLTTRPATPVLIAAPDGCALPCVAPPPAPAPCEAPAPAPCEAPAPAPCEAAAPAPCEAPAPAPAPAEAAPAPAPEAAVTEPVTVEAPAEAPVEAPAEEVAPAAPCAPCAVPVACCPAVLKRKMVCTRSVNISGGSLGGRPYTITRRVSCRPRSIYYWK